MVEVASAAMLDFVELEPFPNIWKRKEARDGGREEGIHELGGGRPNRGEVVVADEIFYEQRKMLTKTSRKILKS